MVGVKTDQLFGVKIASPKTLMSAYKMQLMTLSAMILMFFEDDYESEDFE